MKLTTAKTVLHAYLSANVPVFVWGAPGLGKSDLVREIAREESLALIDVRAILLDPVDLRGLPIVSGDSSRWVQPAFLPQAERDGEYGILFLDELNAAPASVQAACFQLILDRQLGEYQLPPGWRIVAAGNRQSDKAAAQRMPSALANRFAHIDVEANTDSWVQWAMSVGIDPRVIAFIRFRPALLHDMPERDARAFPTPRAWAQASKFCDSPKSIRMSLINGLIGEPAAIEFEGFLRVWENLPDIDAILRGEKSVSIPTDSQVAELYAVATALARRVTRESLGNVMEYLKRLPREFEILSVCDAIRRDKTLQETQAFTSWAIANKDVTL